jgi:hypothetical protein
MSLTSPIICYHHQNYQYPPYARPDKPQFLRIYRSMKLMLEEDDVLPAKPVPHTSAAINRAGRATKQVDDATWGNNGLKKRPSHHHHITGRLNLMFVSVTMNAHGSSLIGGSAKLIIPGDRSSYPARATNKLLGLRNSSGAHPEAIQADHTTLYLYPAEYDDNTEKPTANHLLGGEHQTGQPLDMVEDTLIPPSSVPNSRLPQPIEAPWPLICSTKCRPPYIPADSDATIDYEKRVVSVRLALRSVSPTSRQHLAEEYVALLADDPLLMPSSGGEKQRPDPDFRHSLAPPNGLHTPRPTPPLQLPPLRIHHRTAYPADSHPISPMSPHAQQGDASSRILGPQHAPRLEMSTVDVHDCLKRSS